MGRNSFTGGERAKLFRPVGIGLVGRLGSLLLLLGAAVLGAAEPVKTMVFFGDSITAGAGVDPDEAYPAVLQRKLSEAHRPWRVVNAGLSGETTSGGLRRLDWVLRQPVDLIVIELGGNDGLRGISPALTRSNLQAMIDLIHQVHPATRIVLAGMQMPTNLGPDYTREFAQIYPQLAEHNHILLIPFLLAGVGGVPELNQPDGIHPTPEGHRKVAETVWAVLAPVL